MSSTELSQRFDVLVVGAGPAGSSTAYHLAKEGWHVGLVDRAHFPRPKCCGDGLTWGAVESLRDMGVLPHLVKAHSVHGITVHMRDCGVRTFEYEHGSFGLVVRREHLDHTLVRASIEAGAEFYSGTEVRKLTRSGERFTGVIARSATGQICEVRTNVIVAADGANSRLARLAGLTDNRAETRGFAMRCYVKTPRPTEASQLEFMMPLFDRESRVLASYGWVFPLGPTTFNLGVGIFSPDRHVNLRRLFERFLCEQQDQNPVLRGALVVSTPVGAPLTFGFSPNNIHRPGLITVGDAAGLVNPFTGEGIALALDSGKLAAHCITKSLKAQANGRPCSNREYSQQMRRRYTGLFETGRRANRRTALVWHVLHDSFDNDRPLFELCRKVLLYPERMDSGLANNTLPKEFCQRIFRDFPSLKSRTLAINERLLATVRTEWPFLARAVTQLSTKPGERLRPALLVGLTAGSDTKDVEVENLGAALELALLGLGFQQSVVDDPPNTRGRRKNQSNVLAIVCSDFLLTRALVLCSEVGAGYCELLQNVLVDVASSCASLRIKDTQITVPQYIEHVQATTGRAFAAACLVGGRLASRDEASLKTLQAYGQHLGTALHLAADLRSCENSAPWRARVQSYESWPVGLGLPMLSTLNRGEPIANSLRLMLQDTSIPNRHQRALELVKSHGGPDECRQYIQHFAADAQREVRSLDAPLWSVLAEFAEHCTAETLQLTC